MISRRRLEKIDRRMKKAVAERVKFESVKENQNWNSHKDGPVDAGKGCAVLGVGALLGAVAAVKGWRT
jgi:hypothetical protein